MSQTFINDPSTGVGGSHSQANSGALMGAAQGAAAGAVFGPVGAVVGGVVGAIGGFFGGGKMDKATKNKKKAEKWAGLGKEREAALSRNRMLREFRQSRAEAAVMVGAEGGQSSSQGAISAVGSQYAFNDAFFGGQTMIGNKVAMHMRKAGRSAAQANQIFGAMDALSSAATAIGSYGLNFGGSSAPKVGELGPIPNIPFNPSI